MKRIKRGETLSETSRFSCRRKNKEKGGASDGWRGGYRLSSSESKLNSAGLQRARYARPGLGLDFLENGLNGWDRPLKKYTVGIYEAQPNPAPPASADGDPIGTEDSRILEMTVTLRTQLAQVITQISP